MGPKWDLGGFWGFCRGIRGLWGSPRVPRGSLGVLRCPLGVFGGPPPPYACTECGQASGRQGALHRHYIQHARGELGGGGRGGGGGIKRC